jgi:hypothetical protein
VAEGLQQELEATQQYLKEKHKPPEGPSKNEEQRGTGLMNVIEVHSSDEEEDEPTCIRKLGWRRETDEAVEDEPESSK